MTQASKKRKTAPSARRRKRKDPRVTLTQKLIPEAEGALWDLVVDYFANGPRLGSPVVEAQTNGKKRRISIDVRGPWDIASWEDRGELELIQAVDEAQRQGTLADFAYRVAILRQMEEEARNDDQTLLELAKFDIRYLALPEFVDRLYWAKLNTLGATVAVADRSRRFLEKLADIIRNTPKKTPKTPYADHRLAYQHLMGTMQQVFPQQVLAAAAQHPDDKHRRVDALEKLYHEQKTQSGLPVPNLAYLIDFCCPPLDRVRVYGAMLAREFGSLAIEVLSKKYGISEENLRNQIFKPGGDTPYFQSYIKRDWRIVESWYARHESEQLMDAIVARIRSIAQPRSSG